MFDYVPPDPWEPTQDAIDAVDHFIDAVTERQSWHSGETYFICRLCNEADGHDERCPVPTVQRWLAEGGA